MDTDNYTYRVVWSPDDGEHVGLCQEFPSMSWLAPTRDGALAGIRRLVSEVLADMGSVGEEAPAPRTYRSGPPVGLTPAHHHG